MPRTTSDILDEWLVLRCQSGEEAALPQLVARWHTRLYRHARRLVDRADVADDATQEAWLAIVRGMKRLDDPARFGPWAYRIVTNKCRDRIRQRIRQRRREGPEQISLEDVSERVQAGEPGDAHTRDGSIAALRLAMRELSPAHRAALGLHYLDGMGVAEIAMALGIAAGTVKSRLHHARQHLRAIIERNERTRT